MRVKTGVQLTVEKHEDQFEIVATWPRVLEHRAASTVDIFRGQGNTFRPLTPNDASQSAFSSESVPGFRRAPLPHSDLE
jgi:hypothetical protein